MAIDLAQQRSRTISIISKYTSYYKYSNKDEQIIISSSLLNIIWNNWCKFWRNYWIANIGGGIYFDKSIIMGIFPNYDTPQLCAYLSHLQSIPVKRYTPGSRLNHFSEPTWGDYNKIINIASNLSTITSLGAQMTYLLGLLPSYKAELIEFQIIRNSFIHLNNNSIKQLEQLRQFYIFQSSSDILDILNAKRIGNSKVCFQSINDNLMGLLRNL